MTWKIKKLILNYWNDEDGVIVSSKHAIVYGLHAARAVLEQAPETVLEIWIQENKRTSGTISKLTGLAGSIPLQYVSKTTLDRLAQYGRHQGIVIRKQQASTPVKDCDDLIREIAGVVPLILVLDVFRTRIIWVHACALQARPVCRPLSFQRTVRPASHRQSGRLHPVPRRIYRYLR